MTTTPVQKIIKAYLSDQSDGSGPLPYQAFARRLVEDIPGLKITRQEICLWVNGDQEPGVKKLVAIYHNTTFTDWRHQFAADIMAAKLPELFAPESEIGKSILSQ